MSATFLHRATPFVNRTLGPRGSHQHRLWPSRCADLRLFVQALCRTALHVLSIATMLSTFAWGGLYLIARGPGTPEARARRCQPRAPCCRCPLHPCTPPSSIAASPGGLPWPCGAAAAAAGIPPGHAAARTQLRSLLSFMPHALVSSLGGERRGLVSHVAPRSVHRHRPLISFKAACTHCSSGSYSCLVNPPTCPCSGHDSSVGLILCCQRGPILRGRGPRAQADAPRCNASDTPQIEHGRRALARPAALAEPDVP